MESVIDNFRDRHSTVNEKGKRNWVYAYQPAGKLYAWRSWISYLYILLFVAIPFIKVGGMPLLQLNLPEGEFSFFGFLFTPQDFIVFGICMLIGILFIVIFTVIYGRVFCGWVCPQTIFMEMIFRKIEYWIEGSAQTQKKNDTAKYTSKVRARKILKHIVFFILSFCIANLFLAYIIGINKVYAIINSSPLEHLGGFIAMIVFTLVFYSVYAFLREIVCTVICPYGRLQSVLVDKNTLTVIYDFIRGEPRSKNKNRSTDSGDCIDCKMCMHVCPTNIDIRNGTQLECINCTACIDACNTIMHKIGKAPNLIKIDAEANIKEGKRFRFDYRVKAYSGLLVILLILLTCFLVSRKIFDATVLRVPGQIAQEQSVGKLSNLYRIKITNKTNNKLPYELLSTSPGVTIQKIGKSIDSLPGRQMQEEMFFLITDEKNIKKRKQVFELILKSDKKEIDRLNAIFISN
jgi:cytochrome c oxidase accessory protein FixG